MTDIEEKNVSPAADQDALDPQSELLDQSLKSWAEIMPQFEKTISDIVLNSDEFAHIDRELLGSIADKFATLFFFSSFLNKDENPNIGISPYLKKELEKPQYKGKTILQLLRDCETDGAGLPAKDSLFMLAFENAIKARDAKANADLQEQLTRVTAKKVKSVEYPLDKVNSKIWNLLEEDTGGQLAFAFKMEKARSNKEISLYYSINFDDIGNDIQISKRLTPFDKRVYIAISALFNAGNKVITLNQIHKAMGYTDNPSENQRQKINDSITKMMAARITVDNTPEATVYKYKKFVYDGSLLPLERGTAIVNGKLADVALNIFREPPVTSFAKMRNQITTLDIKLLQSPINKTDLNIAIDDYLTTRIARMKNGKSSHRILFKTLYENVHIETTKQKQRAPQTIARYLDYYKECGFIKRYTQQQDGVTIFF